MDSFKPTVYHSLDARHLLHNLYRKCLIDTPVPVSERMVETSFGDTHVVLYGNPSGQPVMAFCGNNVVNPQILLPFVQHFDMERLLLVAPDVPGCIGFSYEYPRSMSAGDYGTWATAVMNALSIHNAAVFGYSFGAGIALQLCRTALLRVERLLLVNPSCILRTPSIPETPQPISQYAIPQKEISKLLTTGQIKKLNAPVFVAADDNDPLFPGSKILRQAEKLFRNITALRLSPTTDDLFVEMSGFLVG